MVGRALIQNANTNKKPGCGLSGKKTNTKNCRYVSGLTAEELEPQEEEEQLELAFTIDARSVPVVTCHHSVTNLYHFNYVLLPVVIV